MIPMRFRWALLLAVLLSVAVELEAKAKGGGKGKGKGKGKKARKKGKVRTCTRMMTAFDGGSMHHVAPTPSAPRVPAAGQHCLPIHTQCPPRRVAEGGKDGDTVHAVVTCRFLFGGCFQCLSTCTPPTNRHTRRSRVHGDAERARARIEPKHAAAHAGRPADTRRVGARAARQGSDQS